MNHTYIPTPGENDFDRINEPTGTLFDKDWNFIRRVRVNVLEGGNPPKGLVMPCGNTGFEEECVIGHIEQFKDIRPENMEYRMFLLQPEIHPNYQLVYKERNFTIVGGVNK